ncbi:alpha/beta hydrolase [Sphingomonas guangdongensis]|uniref:alpha/beta hydrolase n=1 Tax=Sphingomonas guangdongensis TaxID=1141890 RepID=UPI001FE5EB7C|nr:alpha/beta hydrolase [Sphingomonas guangdongensis]
MAATALTLDRLQPVILSGHPARIGLADMLAALPINPGRLIPCRADTPAQRNVTASLIDDAVAGADRAVLLVAEGIGCAAAAWWARLSPRAYVERVAGALLIDPASGDQTASFASPRSVLPFPSLVLGTGQDAKALSGEWGSRLLAAPETSAAAPRSGPFRAMIQRFTTAIVEGDVGRARRLLEAVGEG